MENLKLIPILLPTDDQSLIFKEQNEKLTCYDVPQRQTPSKGGQHLYLCSTLPIKTGNWYYLPKENKIAQCVKGLNLNGVTPEWTQKIEFTTDPKIWMDDNNVKPIDGNTKAIIRILNDSPSSYTEEGKGVFGYETNEVDFLTEFCKRYNQKDNKKETIMFDAEKPYIQKEVDVQRLTETYIQNGKDFKAEGFSEYQNGKMNGFIDGYNQALQSNTGVFSEKNLIKAIGMSVIKNPDGSFFYTTNEIVECIKNEKSLSKEQPKGLRDKVVDAIDGFLDEVDELVKGDIVIECEMESVRIYKNPDIRKADFEYQDKIKSKDGQPILIFK